MRFVAAFCLFFLTSFGLASPVKVEGTKFRTSDGQQILLRGVNVGGNSKIPPFRAIHSSKDFAPLRGWGFNTVRLLFNWEAFEPEKGVYDWDYLNYYRQMVDWAAEQNLYTIVDIHQDGFSRFSIGGCGEGFPQWTLPANKKAAVPNNGKDCANWGTRMMFDLDMHDSWHHFYANTYGVRDRYLSMLRLLTKAVADAPNLVGFDLINEPWGVETSELPALYLDAGKVVQEIAPDAVLFLSSHALTSSGIFGSQLPPIPLKNIVYAPHFYDPGLFTFQTWTRWALNTAFDIWNKIQKKWQSPLFLGEFGAPQTLKNAADYTDNIYDLMDRELYSGAQWVYTPDWNPINKDGWNAEDFSINDDKGTLRGTYRPRPFVEEAPGDLLQMRWDEKAKTLSVTYDANIDREELLISVPSRLKWIDLKTSDLGYSCRWIDTYRLLCANTQRARVQRALTLQFQSN